MQPARATSTIGSQPDGAVRAERDDPLFVHSVEKAFRVLTAFDAARPTLSLSQLAAVTGLDKSAAQRFAHTLQTLGYLRKDPRTKHFALTLRTLSPAHHYTQSDPLVRRAVPYLLQLSRATDGAANLTMLDGTEIVFVALFTGRHAVTTPTTVGTRSPAYCTAPGIAMLSRLPLAEVQAILRASTLRAYTPHTVWRMPEVMTRVRQAAARGYAVCSEEMLIDDVSVAAAVMDGNGRPVGAVNLAVSKIRSNPADVEARYAPLVIAAAQAVSD
jgi:DNA-binding IclR family transcriptional regulator